MVPMRGRLLLINSVLSAIPIHAMLALDIPQKIIKAMNKICRCFVWCAKDQANGGQCMVAWEIVCSPKWAGGLDIPNLRWRNIAVHARWPWLQRVDSSRPWSEFTIKVPAEALCLFQAATKCEAHCGQNTLYWEDRWINGMRVQEIAPTIYGMIPRCVRLTKHVAPAIEDGSWAMDVGPDLGEQALREFLSLWLCVHTWEPEVDVPDKVAWSWEPNGRCMEPSP